MMPRMITALILAAGQSSRMGQHKMLLPLQGKPLLLHAVDHALAVEFDEVIVVVGHHANDVRATLAGHPVRIVENPEYQQGQSTSVRAGIAALDPAAKAVIVLLGDQPLITPAILKSLMQAWQHSGKPIVVPFYGGQRGNPVLFARALFPELLQVTGDQGGREVLQRHAEEIEPVQIDDANAAQDLDTLQEYQALQERLRNET
jgi:molybdenum cofactor cytidylyltransferase